MGEIQRLIGIATGNWIAATGTTVKAIGETEKLFQETLRGKLFLITGNAGQGLGNAIIASLEEDSFIALGNWIQSAGSSSNSVVATLELFEEEIDFDPIKVSILGDALQALGSQMTAKALRADATLEELIRALGNRLQTLGAILEGIGGLNILKNNQETGQLYLAIGAWIQAIGGSIQAIVATKKIYSGSEN